MKKAKPAPEHIEVKHLVKEASADGIEKGSVVAVFNEKGTLAGYAKLHSSRQYDLPHNIQARIFALKNEKEANQLFQELNQALASRQLQASRGTVRKWGKWISQRILAMRRAKLYDPEGNPVL